MKITEQVDVTGEEIPAMLILRAMATYVEDDDFHEKFAKNGKVVEVVMTVNGHSVPIVESLADTWRQCKEELDRRARKIAVEMVTEAGLEPLAKVLRDAERSIREKLGVWDE